MLIKKQNKENLKKAFGTLRCNKPTQQIMDEIDASYDETTPSSYCKANVEFVK